MPGGNRRLLRATRSGVPPSTVPLIPGDISSTRYSPLGGNVPTLPGLETPTSPKHIPFPPTPTDNDLIFELLMFFFSATVSGLQFLNLYRSVWWFQHSYTDQAMNFYLIDGNLVVFILVVLSRRIVYLLGCEVLQYFFKENLEMYMKFFYRLLLFCFMGCTLTWCSYAIIQNHPMVNIFYLSYPVSVYLILFGFSITPLFELHKSGFVTQIHACTSNAQQIRSEVDNLRNTFNTRMKHILFNSILVAYYAGFIPCCFAPNYLYYEVFWASIHVVFIFLSCFTAYANHLLPLKFCDTLHRATLHLGNWLRVESRNVLPVTYTWQDDVLWPTSAMVKHGRGFYKAQGEVNAAEPGNNMYSRFYAMFKNPSASLGILLLFHVTLVLSQLTLLIVRCRYWHNILTVMFLCFFNYYTLYKLCRDYFISQKVYKLEFNLKEKSPTMH